MGEADVPAQQPEAGQAARLPSSHEHARRPGDPEVAPGQGAPSAVGLIGPIRGRAVFGRFRSEGRRFRHDPLWLSWIRDDEVPSRTAFAVGRSVGSAVIRNRVRRRLRALLAEEARAGLPGGWYLVGATPAAATATFDELRTALGECLTRVRREAAR
jgi:ribonuclease P protein component